MLFGLVALFVPGMALRVRVLVFGAYALVDGAFVMVAGVVGPRWHSGALLVPTAVVALVVASGHRG